MYTNFINFNAVFLFIETVYNLDRSNNYNFSNIKKNIASSTVFLITNKC